MFDHRSGRHVEIDGARIYVEEHGAASDPALLFLHGGMGTIEDFNAITSHFERSFRMIGIDSRGHGASTLGTSGLSYARLQADVEHVVRQLALDRFDVVGFSDGGIVALRMAAGRKMPIGKMVLIGTEWMLKPDDPVRPILSGVTAEGWNSKFPDTLALYRRINPAPDFAALVDAIKPMWLDDGPDGYPGDSIGSIRCKALVIHGDDDRMVSRENTFTMVERIEGASLLNLPFADHEAHKDQPEAVMRSVNAFLAER